MLSSCNNGGVPWNVSGGFTVGFPCRHYGIIGNAGALSVVRGGCRR